MINNKAMRILIVDDSLERSLQIEKWLNRLGYYRIAPIRCPKQLLSLTEYPSAPFGLLIVSRALVEEANLDMHAFCLERPNVLRTLIF
ncbi:MULTISPECIES: hypothetical protein [unclassified Pseudomonas]|uniref:hypothetical protein n=1 Tax=unclassified Pseudomonas TaxID=196821 RepID=UPI0005392039|nr:MULTISPECIES: hypothetical protein [unclassified Pseudomonas]MBD0683043.1 hypothetical protein [Pseudomonas sp. PSB18]CDF92577.1 hypothetical protein BN844_2001 [Pseudomonas sp. SHC52]